MSEERLEILRMVAAKAISVDDAERLLRALDDGEQKRHQDRCGRGGHLGAKLEGLGEALGGIGTMVHGAVQDALAGIGVEIGEDEEGSLAEAALEEGRFTIPEGTKLEIRQRRSVGESKGGELELSAVEGDVCTVGGPDVARLRVLVGSGRAVIRWQGGPLKVAVPATVTELKALVMGGAIRAAGIDRPMALKTMGGDLDLADLSQPFEVRTMGGRIHLTLAAGLAGESRATTMGGDILVAAPAGLPAEVKAMTMAGKIEVEPGLGRVRTDKDIVRQRATVVLGEAEGEAERAQIGLKTMGGSIRIQRSAE